VLNVRGSEIRLVQKMEFMGKKLKAEFGTDLTLAASTIGAISYYGEAQVIDMLGLTDGYIARHPEQIEGIPGSWNEKKYNATYVLSRDPDFIVFSTFHKPSAPAERALFLHSKFRQGYYIFYLPWKRSEFEAVFRRNDQSKREDQVSDDPEFVNLYNEGMHHMMQGRYEKAIGKLLEVTRVAPRDFALPYEQLGLSYWYLEDYQKAFEHLRRAVTIDPFSVVAHLHLAHIYFRWQRYEEASQEFAEIDLYNPGFKTDETEILRRAVDKARAKGQ
jgi:tetratricopeptide (TPR) repeat protein